MTNRVTLIKSRLEDYVNEITSRSKVGGTDMYICPLCGSGTPIADGKRHDGAFHLYGNSKDKWKCHACGRGGTIIDLYGLVNNIDTQSKDGVKAIIQSLEAKYNLSKDFSFQRVSAQEDFKDILTPEEQAEQDYIEKEIQLCLGACKHTVGFSDYLTKRGISLELQKRFNVGYFGEWLHPKTKWKHRGNPHINDWVTPRIIIPTSDSSYLARITTPEPPKSDPQYKYYVKAYKVGGVRIFNPSSLTGRGYCFIFEGEIDALSCIELGLEACAIGSTSNIELLFRSYGKAIQQASTVLILALDNDDAGRKATTKAIDLCNQWGIAYSVPDVASLYGGLKDCNDALQSDRKRLQEALEVVKAEALKVDTPTSMLEAIAIPEVQVSNYGIYPDWIYLTERGKRQINELKYCAYITAKLQIKTIKGKILTIDKELEDGELENLVFSEISEYITQDIALRTKKLVSAIKIYSFSQPLKADSSHIHLQNGTYSVASKTFDTAKKWCVNRLSVSYNPNAPTPTKWLCYLHDLLNPDDITTLQEFLGYCLIPTCKAQIMLFLIGSGGEGKSVIADILRALMGDDNLNDDKVHELQSNRFKVANCENKLLNIDDDLNFKALEDTGLIKSVITGANISVEQKGKQAYKIKPYCRLLAFGNGALNSLYDHTTGFYRRQVIINTKPKPNDRIDNPFLADEIIATELEAILLWLIEGLNRLIANNYKISISANSKQALADLRSEAFNFVDYLQDTDEVQFDERYEETSVDIYAGYCMWCYTNALKPLKNRTILTYLKDHATEYNVQPSEHIYKNNKRARGFKGIRVTKYNQPSI